jgi:hypothetical protein
MRNRRSLELRILLHHPFFRLSLRRSLSSHYILVQLPRQQQNVLRSEAISNAVNAIGSCIGEFLFCGGQDRGEDRQDFLGRVAREPHVDRKGFSDGDDAEFDLFEDTGFLFCCWGGGCGGCWGGVAVESGGMTLLVCDEMADWVEAVLIRHDDQETFGGIFVGLDLVVGAVDACAACQEQEELRRRMRVVSRLGDVDVGFVEFGDLLLDCSADAVGCSGLWCCTYARGMFAGSCKLVSLRFWARLRL